MLRWSTILLALLLSAPALWRALMEQVIPVDTAVFRFLLAVPIAAVLLGLLRAALTSRAPQPEESLEETSSPSNV